MEMSKESEEIGLIKFTPNTIELAKDKIFYLSKLDTFISKPNEISDKINDPDEGYIYLKDNDRVSYDEIVSNYYRNCQAYISCFTILYRSDFDEAGKLKNDVCHRFLTENNNGSLRDAVIFNVQKKYSLMNILNNINNQTTYFQNPNTTTPEIIYDKKLNKFIETIETCNTTNESYVTSDDKKNYTLTFYSNRINYEDSPYDSPNRQEFLSKLTKSDKINEYLKKCLFKKKKAYEDQHEYRILVTQFSDSKLPDATKLPDAIKLHYPNEPLNWWAKVVKKDDIANLSITDFIEKDGNESSIIRNYNT